MIFVTLKLLLLVLFLAHCRSVMADQERVGSSLASRSAQVRIVSRQEDTHRPGTSVVTPSAHRENNLTTMRYIVWVTTVGGLGQLREYSEQKCTATLIRADLVLTLASCLLIQHHDDPYIDLTKVHERPDGHVLFALKVFINPNFYSEDEDVSTAHDFAVILVEKSAQSVFPRLPESFKNFKDIKDTCVLAGYGAESNAVVKDNFKAFELNKTDVEVLRGDHCLGDGGNICLRFSKIMPCVADFGSPLICNGVLYALYTPRYNRHRRLSTKCFDFYMTTFSPVYNVMDWVTTIVEVPSTNLEWLNNPWYVLILCVAVFIFMGGIYYGLMEVLQRNFDPADRLRQMPLSLEVEEDEESWNESQWVIG